MHRHRDDLGALSPRNWCYHGYKRREAVRTAHEVIVLESALKHGYSEQNVRYAWCHYVNDVKDPNRDAQSARARTGLDRRGRELEMLGHRSGSAAAWVVFHAMRPRGTLLGASGLGGGRHAHRG